MKYPILLASIVVFCATNMVNAQNQGRLTKADTLRGTITPERAWWNITRYDLEIQPDYVGKTLIGTNTISYTVVQPNKGTKMQIDLKEPLQIKEVVDAQGKQYSFSKEG